MPTFLSPHRLGLLVALVAALTATWWGLTISCTVLLVLALSTRGTLDRVRPRGVPRVTPTPFGVPVHGTASDRGISLDLAALRQRHVEHLQAP